MKILIVDTSGYYHRAFSSWPQDPPAQLRSYFEQAIDAYKPERIFFALDVGRETFRNRIYPGYKANRKPPVDGFAEAKESMRLVLNEFSDEIIGVPDYESDDVIGSLCHKYDNDYNCEIRILSRDKDLNQLVCENVEQHDDVTGVTYDERAVIIKWGVKPQQIPEVLGLSGDSVDNIPGVVGVGPKIAKELIQWYETLENLYADLHTELGGVAYLYARPDKLIKKLEAGKENAFMSRDLATIRRNIL